MKKSILFPVFVLAGSLLLAGCNNASADNTTTEGGQNPTTIPAAKKAVAFEVTNPEAIGLGEFDLDEFVGVSYNDGSKDKVYEVEADEESAAVLIDGHKVTVLEEGEVFLRLKAGEVEGLFETVAAGTMRARFAEVAKKAAQGYALMALSQSPYYACFHQPTYHAIANQQTHVLNGLLETTNGKVYGFELSADLKDLQVKPGAESFDNYWWTEGFSLDANAFVAGYHVADPEVEGDESGETLELPSDAKATGDYASSFANAADQFFRYSVGLKLPDGYTYENISVLEQQLDDESYQHALVLRAHADATPEQSLVVGAYLLLTGDDAKLAPVEAYIESGEEPVVEEVTIFAEAFAEIYKGKNFTVKAENCVDAYDSDYKYVGSYPSVVETMSVTESAFKYTMDDGLISGYVENDGTLYEIQEETEGEGEEATTKLVGVPADGTVWENVVPEFMQPELALQASYDGFVISKTTEDEEKGTTTYELSVADCANFLEMIYNFSGNAASEMEDVRAYVAQKGKTIYDAGYVDLATIVVSEGKIEVTVECFVGGNSDNGYSYYDYLVVSFEEVGTTAVEFQNVEYQEL